MFLIITAIFSEIVDILTIYKTKLADSEVRWFYWEKFSKMFCILFIIIFFCTYCKQNFNSV